jgi:uncharacterized protein (UPF0332 family)
MDPRDFIALSEYLMETKKEVPSKLQESLFRTGISRIYYGILHWVKQQYKIIVPKSELTRYHSWVVRELKRIADDEFILEFNFLRDARIDADYELRKSIDEHLIKQCIDSKNRLLKIIQERPRIPLPDDEFFIKEHQRK